LNAQNHTGILVKFKEDKGQQLYADSAYIGEPIDTMLRGTV